MLATCCTLKTPLIYSHPAARRCFLPIFAQNPFVSFIPKFTPSRPKRRPLPGCFLAPRIGPVTRPHIALTLGLLPPMAPGRMEPVSWYLQRILETQPWETLSCLEITQGRIPW